MPVCADEGSVRAKGWRRREGNGICNPETDMENHTRDKDRLLTQTLTESDSFTAAVVAALVSELRL